jgi:PAS domain S-box-containing protein
MLKPIMPVTELSRLNVLRQTQLLDTAAESRFDRITALAQQSLNTEIVLVSLVDAERQWFKSKQGIDACETSRDISFCGHAILSDSIFEIPDATKDERFADNPLVVSAPFIRFYAGVPLSRHGQNIGTLCFIDPAPRKWSNKEQQIAVQFAALIEQEIEDRLQEQAHQALQHSELMYRSVLEGTRIGTWQWNVQTGETIFNERWAEIVGYQLADFAPISINTWLSLCHPDDLAESARLLQLHFAGGIEFYDCKCRMKHRDGHYVWVHDRGRVISWTNDGKPLMMYGTHADVTEQHQNELALIQSRDQFQSLVANIPGVTYRSLADEHRSMLYMSDHITQLSGYPANDFIHNKVLKYASVIHPDDRDWRDDAVKQALLQHTSWTLQYRILDKNGLVRWVDERGSAHYSPTGSVLYLDGFILDVSNAKKMQDQLVKLTQQLPGVVYQFQLWPDGRMAFPYASAAIEQIYGVLPEDVIEDASAVLTKIYPDDLPILMQSIKDSFTQQSVWQLEYRVFNEQKQIKWLSGRATPEQLPDGSTLWHGYIHDVTITKEHYLKLEYLNQQLSIAQQSLNLASEQAKIGYWQASLKTGKLWWSPIIYQIFGFDAETTEPSVALFKNTVHPEDLPAVEQSEQQAMQTGIHNVVHRIIRPDGEIRWVHELAQLVPAEKNPDLMLIGSIQDITERMKLQQMKDEFISTVSHELRTPLTSIYGALNLLESGNLVQLPAKAQKLISIAASNCKQLTHLINDLLDIEKLSAGKMMMDLMPVRVIDVLQRAITDHQPYAAPKEIRLLLETQRELQPLQIMLDEHRLLQILANLLSNAVKFSPNGGEVLLTGHIVDDTVEIAIQDQGPGLPEEFKHRIFQRFSQADASSSKIKGGTGLGLALCKELIEAMDGSIGFVSQVGFGARFYVRLPIKLEHDARNTKHHPVQAAD